MHNGFFTSMKSIHEKLKEKAPLIEEAALDLVVVVVFVQTISFRSRKIYKKKMKFPQKKTQHRILFHIPRKA